jgi:predicted transcriptional regulator/N-acetylglutamate synthase-like GNAT family acetyltransferase
MQHSLPFERAVSIVRLTEQDAKRHTPHLSTLRRLLVANEPMYPTIDRWVDRKVIPGLRSGERVAYVAYEGERPVASAVVKPGQRAKFCHLRIDDGLRNGGLGEMLFTLMSLDVRKAAEEVHFTLPESLWEERAGFFQSFGFTERVEAGTQYRLFERELRCSASFETVWQAVMSKLPRVAPKLACLHGAPKDALLMSLKPKWAQAILQGRKRVEIRRSFSRQWTHRPVFLYSTSPVKRIVGEAKIGAVVEASPEEIWSFYSEAIGCAWEEFDGYTRGAEQVYAIELEDPRAYSPELSLSDLQAMVGERLRPPQSYAKLSSSPGWSGAVWTAAVVAGMFSAVTP